jgi:Fe-S-cluster containining protein
MDVDFQCTRCGKCCCNLWLPLSVDEAINWILDGNTVQVLCEAIPWPAELPVEDLQAAFKRERSFPASAGKLPVRVLVTLAAPQRERCPNLNGDGLCAIYARRPAVCRVYPVELNPFRALDPARRLCPPEAWLPGLPALMRERQLTDESLRLLVESVQSRAVNDVDVMAVLCEMLGIRLAALSNEGYVAHNPPADKLLEALRSIRPGEYSGGDWMFVTGIQETQEAILSCDAQCIRAEEAACSGAEYLSLFSQQ